MELDDFKNLFKKSVSELPDEGKKQEERISSVIEAFRAEQAKARKQSILWAVFLVAFSLVYFSRFHSGNDLFNTGMMIIGLGFIMGAIFTWKQSRPLPDNTWSLPPAEFLTVAERWMRFSPPADLFKVIPILIVLGIGGGMVLTSRLLIYTDNLTLVVTIWVLFYTGVCLFGFKAGRKNWEKKYSGLMSMIKDAKRSFMETDGTDEN
jgi:hypothetical protein